MLVSFLAVLTASQLNYFYSEPINDCVSVKSDYVAKEISKENIENISINKEGITTVNINSKEHGKYSLTYYSDKTTCLLHKK